MKNVVITDHQLQDTDVEQRTLGGDFKVTNLAGKDLMSPESLDTLKTADALLVWHTSTINQEVIGTLDRCKSIVRVGVGFDNVDLEAAKNKGIIVSNVPDYGTGDVADHAIAMFLSLEKGFANLEDQLSEKSWNWRRAQSNRRITDLNFGLVGLGRIGTATAMRAKPFCREVGFYDPYLSIGIEKSLNLRRFDTLEELIRWSDTISLHTNLTHETRGMVNDSFIENMKPGSTLINTARGLMFDGTAVLRGLESGKIARLGTDVLVNEATPFDDQLMNLRQRNPEIKIRTIITPHCAFCNQASVEEMRIKAASEAKRVICGETPRSQVNK